MLAILDLDSLIALAGNASITVASGLVLFFIGLRLYRNARIPADGFARMTSDSVRFAVGLLMWSLGEVVRIGWWVPAIFLAPEGRVYHPWFEAHKGEMMLVVTPLIVVGVAIATRELKGRSAGWLAAFILGSFAVGWVAGLFWWLL